MKRARYTISIRFKKIIVDEVILDQHYRIKHSELTDWLILELIRNLNSKSVRLVSVRENYSYYVAEPVLYKDKHYRMILVTEVDSSYLGVVNAFRVKEKKYAISRR